MDTGGGYCAPIVQVRDDVGFGPVMAPKEEEMEEESVGTGTNRTKWGHI